MAKKYSEVKVKWPAARCEGIKAQEFGKQEENH
jgi:hypothetical protein